MTRLCSLLSHFHISLALALLTVAALAVPEGAFADSHTTCDMPTSGPGYECSLNDPQGMGTCCTEKCGIDTACKEECCCGACSLNYAVGSPEFDDCVAECNAVAAAPGCKDDATCDNGCGMRTPGMCATIVLGFCHEVTKLGDCSLCGCTGIDGDTKCGCRKQ